MKEKFEIKTINASNVDEAGFFCYMSKRKEPGYKQKRDWLEARFAEGMKIKVIHEVGGRDTAFIEYIPGEYAWRAVNAEGYMFIHCLWVVGKGKGKGYGKALIDECILDALKSINYHGCLNVEGVSELMTAAVFSEEGGIAVRNGRFCAHIYVNRLLRIHHAQRGGELPGGAVRASFGVYNDESDVDRFLEQLKKIRDKRWVGRYQIKGGTMMAEFASRCADHWMESA